MDPTTITMPPIKRKVLIIFTCSLALKIMFFSYTNTKISILFPFVGGHGASTSLTRNLHFFIHYQIASSQDVLQIENGQHFARAGNRPLQVCVVDRFDGTWNGAKGAWVEVEYVEHLIDENAHQ